MNDKTFTQALSKRIETEYQKRGDDLGWRLLYSPAHVLDGASVAFIGLNPGGGFKPADHAEFAMTDGSAYKLERWNGAPGESKLQRQAQALFQRLDVPLEDVLAGNLIPFRSRSWSAMHHRSDALAFGKTLWSDILDRARPRLVIAMGRVTIDALADVLNVGHLEKVPVGWGTVKARRGPHRNGIFVGLPHLSRFAIIGRPESEGALQTLFNSENSSLWP